MITILINTKNIFTRYAIEQLMQENVTLGKKLVFEHNYTPINIAQANIIFTEMEPGEIFLCHDELKHKTDKSLLFVLQEKKSVFLNSELPNCTKNLLFLYKADSISVIRNKIKSRLPELISALGDKLSTSQSIRCINCPCKTITQAQSKVIHALNLGLNQLQIG